MTSPGLKMASVGDNEKMTMRLNCGLIAMAGGWVHTVHSAHDQMEQLFVVMLAKSSINSGSIVSTGLEFPQATVLAEPWVSLSELAIILWNDHLEARIGIALCKFAVSAKKACAELSLWEWYVAMRTCYSHLEGKGSFSPHVRLLSELSNLISDRIGWKSSLIAFDFLN